MIDIGGANFKESLLSVTNMDNWRRRRRWWYHLCCVLFINIFQLFQYVSSNDNVEENS